MSGIERRLKDLGEQARREVTASPAPRPDALRRIRFRRGLACSAVALSIGAVVVGGAVVAGGGSGGGEVRPADDATEGRGTDDRPPCGIGFEPTYVPPGFDPEARAGSGGAGDAPAAGVVGHFSGGPATHVEVLRSHDGFALTGRTRVTVLGSDATLGNVHEGYAVEFRSGRCDYALVGYGVTRLQLRRFAEGLVSGRSGEELAAVWPEDTIDAATRACAGRPRGRSSSARVARRFVQEVLGWERYGVEISGRGDQRVVEVRSDPSPGEEPAMELFVEEVLPDCWSVQAVGPHPARRRAGAGISVRGRRVEIAFDTAGATSASIEVGYGGRTETAAWDGGEGLVRLDLRFEADTTGHFLVLLRDARGEVFSASGGPLPPGDFVAG